MISQTYVNLDQVEKKVITFNANGLDVSFQALAFEHDLIVDFISEIDDERQKSRKTTRIISDCNIEFSVSFLSSYLSDNYSYSPTKQEVFWLLSRYLLSKFPGFRS